MVSAGRGCIATSAKLSPISLMVAVFLIGTGIAHADTTDYIREQMDAHFTLLEKIQVLQNRDLNFGAIAFGGQTVTGVCRIILDPTDGASATRTIGESSSRDCANATLVGDGASIGELVYDGSVGEVTVPDEDLPFAGVDAWLRPAIHHDAGEKKVFVGGELRLDADRRDQGLNEGRYTVTIDVDLHYPHLE